MRRELPAGALPLDTVQHARAALNYLDSIPHRHWPRILGAATGYGLIPLSRARELLAQSRDMLQWWCGGCYCSQVITCLWCDGDACAKCWRCVTPGCGEDVDVRVRRVPSAELGSNGYTRGALPGFEGFVSTDGVSWAPVPGEAGGTWIWEVAPRGRDDARRVRAPLTFAAGESFVVPSPITVRLT